jgi:putative transcriptional regulator
VSTDILIAIANGEGPAHWQLVLGYAGWGAGQLDREITEHSWHIADADDRILFMMEPDQRWATLLARDGIDPARLVAAPTAAGPS